MKALLLKFGILAFVFVSFSFMLYSPYTDGTPEGYSGSPHDGNDCSACHAKAVFKENLISINADSNGYEPGKKYTINTTLAGDENARKFGFQIAPQNAKGKLMGTLVVTNAEETKLFADGKCINQIAKGVPSVGSKTWTFDWIAPEKGTGDVVFYGSYLIGGKKELVYNSTLTLKEKK